MKEAICKHEIGFCIILIATCAAAHPLEDWTWRHPLPQGNTLLGLSFVEPRFVAVGTGGTILQSTDGKTWSRTPAPTTQDLTAVASGGGTLVAVGANGTVLYSGDGAAWTVQPSPTTNALYSVAYGNGKFVAVGFQVLLVSADGKTWADRSPTLDPYSPGFLCVAFGNGSFVAAGYGCRFTSADGLQWSSTPTDDWFYSDMRIPFVPTYYSMIYAGGQFVAHSPQGHLHSSPNLFRNLSVSQDGRNWISEAEAVPQAWGNDSLVMAYGNGIYAGAVLGQFYTSSNGLNWLPQGSGFQSAPHALAFGNGVFVAVGEQGGVMISADATNWVQQSVSLSEGVSLSGFAARGGRNIFVGGSLQPFILTSTNGTLIRASVPSGILGLNATTCSDSGRFVAVGGEGALVVSDDGVNWSARNSATAATLFGVDYGDGKFVAVGTLGTIVVSTSGDAWSLRAPPTSKYLHDVARDDLEWVAVGDSGSVFTSKDTLVWDAQYSSVSVNLYGVGIGKDITGSNLFVACGEGGTIITSPDGSSWTQRVSGVQVPLTGVSYAHGIWLAVGGSGTVLSSFDGVNWTRRPSPTLNSFNVVGFNFGSFFIAGEASLILQSGDLDTPGFMDCQCLPNGAMSTYFTGPIGNVWQVGVAATPDATNWAWIRNLTNSSGISQLLDGTTESSRFYRMKLAK